MLLLRQRSHLAASINTVYLGRRGRCAGRASTNETRDEPPSRPIALAEIRRFVKDVMQRVGANQVSAEALADVLMAADYRGHYSHGLNRLEMYANEVASGTCDGSAYPVAVRDVGATALVNGHNAVGPVVGNFAMRLAVYKARRFGVGWVTAHNSNHYGIAAWYSIQAADLGLMGLTFTSTSPLVAPTRAKKAALGTNPLSFAAPALGDQQFVLDIATSVVALGKIEVQRRKGEPIPAGWALDEHGVVTTDAEAAMKGSLLPLGGSEATSGHKGYGLQLLVEILCGITSGATYGPNIRSWNDTKRKADLGQCFIAVDPECFAPGFQLRLRDFMTLLRMMEPVDPKKPVLVPGDPERVHMARVDDQGGVLYDASQILALERLARRTGAEPLRF